MGRAGNHSERRLHALALPANVLWQDRQSEKNKLLPDLSGREWAYMMPLVIMSLWIGVYPKPFLRYIEQAGECGGETGSAELSRFRDEPAPRNGADDRSQHKMKSEYFGLCTWCLSCRVQRRTLSTSEQRTKYEVPRHQNTMFLLQANTTSLIQRSRSATDRAGVDPDCRARVWRW